MRHYKLYLLAAVIVGIIVAAVLGVRLSDAQHWAAVHTGSSNVQGVAQNYNFWSGFGSDLGEYVVVTSIVGGIVLAARKHNCHVQGCPWIGRYHVAGGDYVVCRKHHPDAAIREKQADHLHIHRKHQEHVDRQGMN